MDGNLVLNLTAKNWVETCSPSDENIALKGQVYCDQSPIGSQDFSAKLAACKNIDQLCAFLQRLNGFYAWVEQSAGQVLAAVDHIRSCPLFYGLANRQFYLSDDAEWIRQQVGDREMDPVAREEFQPVGYVTGADTLF